MTVPDPPERLWAWEDLLGWRCATVPTEALHDDEPVIEYVRADVLRDARDLLADSQLTAANLEHDLAAVREFRTTTETEAALTKARADLLDEVARHTQTAEAEIAAAREAERLRAELAAEREGKATALRHAKRALNDTTKDNH